MPRWCGRNPGNFEWSSRGTFYVLSYWQISRFSKQISSVFNDFQKFWKGFEKPNSKRFQRFSKIFAANSAVITDRWAGFQNKFQAFSSLHLNSLGYKRFQYISIDFEHCLPSKPAAVISRVRRRAPLVRDSNLNPRSKFSFGLASSTISIVLGNLSCIRGWFAENFRTWKEISISTRLPPFEYSWQKFFVD